MACYVHQETPGPQRGNVSGALEETELMIKKRSLFADGHSLSQDEKKKTWTRRCVRYCRAEVGNYCLCQASYTLRLKKIFNVVLDISIVYPGKVSSEELRK